MASFVHQMEKMIADNGDRGLDVLLYYHGQDLELWRQRERDDVFGKVHNKNAGNPMEKVVNFSGAIAGDDFFGTTYQQAGVWKEAWLYCRSGDIRVGDEVRIQRTDGRVKAYRVEENPSIGESQVVFTKWKLSGIM